MVRLEPFTESDFDQFISWVDNKALLITIAGTDFTFPLTTPQLLTYLVKEKSHAFKIVDVVENKSIGHAEILERGNELCKIDKLLIGDRSNRSRGVGQATVNSLLDYSFEKLDANIVELNVFDWNAAGIRCYEKCGFIRTRDSNQLFEVEGNIWTAFNMKIDKSRWLELRK